MRAVAKTRAAEGALELIDAPEPEATAGHVLIRPVGGGVCGTDVSIFHWYPALAREYRPAWPLIMGHETAGIVEALGAGVSGLQLGALVAVNPQLNCGVCFHCVAGRTSLCERYRVMGCHLNGGWAERVAVPMRNVHPLPPGVTPAVAPLAEPLTVAVHAVAERVPVQPGDTVLVMGAGTMGLLHLLVAQAMGAARVIVAGVAADRGRLALAAELGAVPVDVDAQELPRVVRAENARGADVAYDTTGHAEAIHPALASLRKGGRLGLVGINHAATTFDSLPVVLEEKELIGVRAYNRGTWSRSVALLAPLADRARRLITHTLPFAEAERAIGLIERRECIKVVLRADA
jgi:2-desacetyl-2-hydroxyethyl bacteriochlorophyllide A dehydrogenase